MQPTTAKTSRNCMDDQKNIEEIRQRVSFSSWTDKTDKTDTFHAKQRLAHQKRLEQLHLEARGQRRG